MLVKGVLSNPKVIARVIPVLALLVIVLIVSPAARLTYAQEGQSITYGQNVFDQVSGPEGKLYYFQGTGGDAVTIQVLGSNFAPTVGLFDETRSNLLAVNSNPENTTSITLTYTLPSSSTYYIQIGGANNATGQFALSLSQGTTDGTTGNQLNPDEPVTGTSSPDAPASYAFSTNPDAPTTIEIMSTTEGYSPVITITNEAGDVIASLDNPLLMGVTLSFAPGQENLTLTVEQGDYPEPANFEINLALETEDTVEETPPTVEVEETEEPADDSPDDALIGLRNPPPGCSLTPPNSNVNVREGGSSGHTVIAVLGQDRYLSVTGTNSANGGWYEVDIPDATTPGWVAGSVINLTGDCGDLPTKSYPSLSASPSPTATYTPSVSSTPGPSGTEDPSGPTATYTPTSPGPTATYTPSYTPTTPPPDQEAPPDSPSNSPLNIDLDSTASVLDFVSYPGGDREDRISYDVRGMNPNVAFSGGRARLVISASCFGENTDQIEFFTGGQTYSCGQTVVDREVTFDSNNGSIRITAVGGQGTYVQWVLTGTATRIN
jgi:hypothetical protein